MALFKDEMCEGYKPTKEVYRVIDDGSCVLTTLDAHKALAVLQGLIEKYDITHCWAEVEELK